MAAKKNTTQKQDLPTVLIPATTSFDFLESAFVKSERARLTGLIINGAALVSLAGVLLVGGMATVEGQGLTSTLESASSQLGTLSAEQATLDSAEGIPTSRITSHIQSRTAALNEAVGGELDTVRLVQDVFASAPPGTTVTQVTFSGADEDTEGLGTMAVTGRSTSFTVLSQWQKSLDAINGLSEVDMSWTGGGENISVEITASLTPAALSARAAATSSAGAPTGPGDPAAPGFDENTQVQDATSPDDLLNEMGN